MLRRDGNEALAETDANSDDYTTKASKNLPNDVKFIH